MSEILLKEFEFFNSIVEDLAKEYAGKFVVISNETVNGIFNTRGKALRHATDNFEQGTYIIQEIIPKATVVQGFHARVAFG